MANQYTKHATLCFNCKTPSPICPWKHNFTPVEGWDAEEVELKISPFKKDKSYIVKSCPLFDENIRKKNEVIHNKYTPNRFKE